MDDAEVVNTGVIEDRPTAAGEEGEEPMAEQVAVPPDTSTAPAPEQRHVWSMPTIETTRKHTEKLGRIAVSVGAAATAVARRIGTLCTGIAMIGWQVIRQVSPVLQLLGALGLGALLSIAGSVALDNALGKTCAVVFVPGFALAFGAVAHHWYRSLGQERQHAPGRAPDLARSVEYVDTKLAFALNALGTDRQQQAVVALIQAKTATELSFGSGQGPERPAPRPRIRVGKVAKVSARESISVVGRS